MIRPHVSSNLALVLAMAAFSLVGPGEETPVEAKAYPLWDGKEAVAAYAKRAGLQPEMFLDLGDGVKMDFVLIPAGKFLMGAPQPESLWIGGGILIGGGTLAFALLTAMVIGMVRRRSFWPRFSLLGLLAFMSALSIVSYGGVLWWRAEQVWANSFEREMPAHEVTLAQPFYMGKFKVTQEQYEKLIKKNPSEFKGAQNPVEIVSWDEAQAFCKRLNEKTGRPVRLPSEAEWEYACRAGSTTPIHPPRERRTNTPLTEEQRRRVAELIPRLGNDKLDVRDKATRDLIALGKGVLPTLEGIKSDNPEIQGRLESVRSTFQPSTDLGSVAWYQKNSDQKTHPVGGKEPNEFGLYDMLGNVLEWVEDDWHKDYTGAPIDGRAWVYNPRADRRVFRGASWDCSDWVCRSAYRYRSEHESRSSCVGFRVVLFAR